MPHDSTQRTVPMPSDAEEAERRYGSFAKMP